MNTPKLPKRPADFIQRAHEVFQESIVEKPKTFDPLLLEDEPELPAEPEKAKDPAAVTLGRKGGLKGGKSRVANMTKAQLSESARRAANARWKNGPREES